MKEILNSLSTQLFRLKNTIYKRRKYIDKRSCYWFESLEGHVYERATDEYEKQAAELEKIVNKLNTIYDESKATPRKYHRKSVLPKSKGTDQS